MTGVLFLVHRIPYPPNKGDKIRSFNILRFLSERHRVYLGAFVDAPEDELYRASLEKYCEKVFLRPAGGWRSKMRAAVEALRGKALGLGYYRDSKMSVWAENLIHSGKIDSVFVFSSTMAQYGSSAIAAGLPFIVDFVDVDSDKWRQYSREKPFPFSLLYRYEAAALAKWERSVAGFADAITLVSDTEKDTMHDVLAGKSACIEVVRNGVDIEFFDPELSYPSPYSPNVPVIVFTGAMDYYANVNAVLWFVQHVWADVSRKRKNAQFHIVGSNPTAAVRSLSSKPGITVVGSVPDIRPYLKHASVAVAPLRVARGVQNKILEALAMRLPIVATPEAVQGLDGCIPKNIGIAARGSEFAELVLRSLSPEALGDNEVGRLFVCENYSWGKNLSVISGLLSRRQIVQSERRSSLEKNNRLTDS